MDAQEESFVGLMRKISVSLPEGTASLLEERAARDGSTVAEVVRGLVISEFGGDDGPVQPTIASVAEEALRRGLTNQEVLALVRERFPEAGTSSASIASYRARLRRDGEDVPTSAEAKAARSAP